MKENKKTLIIVLILLIAIPLIIYLVRQQQILRSRAGTFGTVPIQFTGTNVYSLPNGRVGFTAVNGQPTVQLLLTSNLGSSNSPSATTAPTSSQPSPTSGSGQTPTATPSPSPSPSPASSLTPTLTTFSSVVNCTSTMPTDSGGYVSPATCGGQANIRTCDSFTGENCSGSALSTISCFQNNGGNTYVSWKIRDHLTTVICPL